jgi:hypothetical protein
VEEEPEVGREVDEEEAEVGREVDEEEAEGPFSSLEGVLAACVRIEGGRVGEPMQRGQWMHLLLSESLSLSVPLEHISALPPEHWHPTWFDAANPRGFLPLERALTLLHSQGRMAPVRAMLDLFSRAEGLATSAAMDPANALFAPHEAHSILPLFLASALRRLLGSDYVWLPALAWVLERLSSPVLVALCCQVFGEDERCEEERGPSERLLHHRIAEDAIMRENLVRTLSRMDALLVEAFSGARTEVEAGRGAGGEPTTQSPSRLRRSDSHQSPSRLRRSDSHQTIAEASRGFDPAERRPEGGDPAQRRPEGGDPAQRRPEGGDPAQRRPEGGDPAQRRPEGGDPAERRPEGGDPAQRRPEGGDPAQRRPEGGDPAERRPEGGDPAQRPPAEQPLTLPLVVLRLARLLMRVRYGGESGAVRAAEEVRSGRVLRGGATEIELKVLRQGMLGRVICLPRCPERLVPDMQEVIRASKVGDAWALCFASM